MRSSVLTVMFSPVSKDLISSVVSGMRSMIFSMYFSLSLGMLSSRSFFFISLRCFSSRVVNSVM